jgi:alkaline phosphatase D
MFEDLSNARNLSEAVEGHFRTAPQKNRAIRFLWSGDTAGQGWGINPDFGGMKIYEAMRQTKPDFFIHCGDTIYADGPIQEMVTAENGQIWRNIVTPEVSKVAETLAEFRGRYKYNLLDENVRPFNAEVPANLAVGRSRSDHNCPTPKIYPATRAMPKKDVPRLISHGARVS